MNQQLIVGRFNASLYVESYVYFRLLLYVKMVAKWPKIERSLISEYGSIKPFDYFYITYGVAILSSYISLYLLPKTFKIIAFKHPITSIFHVIIQTIPLHILLGMFGWLLQSSQLILIRMAYRLLTMPTRYFCVKQDVRCMILHPVSFPHKGPVVEQYLAEEAVGLAKSLGWGIVRGPLWNTNHIHPVSASTRRNELYIESEQEQIRDGDYVRTSIGNGIVHKDGIIFDEAESDSQGDLYKEWRDKLLRQSLANSSLIRARRITKKTFFTKGKLNFVADYLAKNDVDCLYINTELKPTQVKNLKKFLQARINNVSPAMAFRGYGQSESETEFETQEQSQLKQRRESDGFRKIRIFDRFSIILQIFAQRSITKLSRLQIELSFLSYLRTRLVRDGATYSSSLNLFFGDLMQTQEVQMEVISARQRRAARTMSGEGESQLQMERRQIRDKQARIRRDIQEETRLRKITQEKNKRRNNNTPVIALVGYTNVGKSAFMNYLMKKEEVKSKDLLFQTLSTTSRQVVLPSGTRVTLLDTIGFITNLPVEMVEAFKSTLQEIAHADLVLHLRDISHPHHDLQKQSVLKILKELKFDQAFYTDRMLQVWNKADLKPEAEVQESAPKISCLTGQGMQELVNHIEGKLQHLCGKQKYEVEYRLQMHADVLDWIKTNTNHTFNIETEYNYEKTWQYPNGSVKIKLDLDDASKGKLNKFLNPDKKRVNKGQKGMPPKQGW